MCEASVLSDLSFPFEGCAVCYAMRFCIEAKSCLMNLHIFMGWGGRSTLARMCASLGCLYV